MEALARAVSALSQLVAGDDPAVLEAEINPLVVLGEGDDAIAVDGWVRLAEEENFHD